MDENLPVRACVGCSFCCRKARCGLALRLYGSGSRGERCPSLVYHDDRWWCKVIEHARGPLHEQYVAELYIGAGCCCGLNTDRQNIPTPEMLDNPPVQGDSKRRGARRRAGVPVDWKKAFDTLSESIGRQWVSGDMLFLISKSLEAETRPEVVLAFLDGVKRTRQKHVQDFMG